MKKNRKRDVVCNRVKDAGFTNPALVADIAGVSLSKVADALLSIQKGVVDSFLEGEARFTGNNRVFSNGAIAVEIRCPHCQLTFWETGLPFAFCVDCRHIKRKVQP